MPNLDFHSKQAPVSGVKIMQGLTHGAGSNWLNLASGVEAIGASFQTGMRRTFLRRQYIKSNGRQEDMNSGQGKRNGRHIEGRSCRNAYAMRSRLKARSEDAKRVELKYSITTRKKKKAGGKKLAL